VTKYKEEILFWLTVSEGSAHGHLAPYFCACSEAVVEAVHLIVPETERESGGGEGGRVWGPGVTFKGTHPVTYFLQLMPTSLSSHHLPK
jgi:hypothetical protein